MINVTQPFLPPYEVYEKYIKEVWEKKWLTNNGPMVQDLEKKLKEFLGVKHLFFVTNGTIALQIAIKVLDLKGEIITTPFSYVATTNAVLWEGCKPVFADIQSTDFNIDPEKAEALITENTRAIMATHVYGNPCEIEKLEAICKKHNLKLIFDAAHAFGTIYKNSSLLSFGDISTCSFHATKLFHTIEGGALITNDDNLADAIMLCRQFGHVGDEYYSIGINGKNSEMHAAMGLSVLPYVHNIIGKRKLLTEAYNQHLEGLPFMRPLAISDTQYNYAYYPVIFGSEQLLLKAKQHLADCSVNTRRYFYPSLNTLSFVNGESCPISEDISRRVLALPIFSELNILEVEKIVSYLKKILK